MKKFIFTLIAAACTLTYASAQRIKIGHRDLRQVAVLDISISQIAPAIIKSMEAEKFTNVKVLRLDISDNPLNPNYYASMGVTVSYQEIGSTSSKTLTYLYPINYDPVSNSYFGGKVELDDIKDGGNKGAGNPDNNFCVAHNCVGCATLRDLNGKTTGCSPCLPTNEQPYSCYMSNTSGEGTSRILTALGSLLKALATIL